MIFFPLLVSIRYPPEEFTFLFFQCENLCGFYYMCASKREEGYDATCNRQQNATCS